MAELQQTRYDRLVRRVGGIIGPGSKVGEVITELFPMLDVENLPAELYLLSGTQLAFGGGAIAGIGLQSPTAQLFNPAGSNVLVSITGFNLATDFNTLVRWGITTTPIGTAIGTEIIRDSRKFPPDFPVADVRQVTAVALASGTNQTRILASTDFNFSPRNGVAVLAPGTGLEIGVSDVGASLNYSFYWRERVAEESEFNI